MTDVKTSAGQPLGQPLKGVPIVALEQAVVMPYCTFVLPEMGTEVIKIERVDTGDVVRGWDSAVHSLSTGFIWGNAGKKSVELDLKSDEGRAALRNLIDEADVFVENLGQPCSVRLMTSSEISDQSLSLQRLVYLYQRCL